MYMKKIVLGVLAICIIGFGYWTISPLFIDKEVNDELPMEEVLMDKDTTSDNEEMMDETMEQEDEMMKKDEPAQEAKEEMRAPIIDTAAHPASGEVRVVENGGQTIVRYENYDGTGGPDLYVYLAKDLDAKEFVSLGEAKGNKGNINYTVPEGVDVEDYPYVLTWCKAFGVLFDYAQIGG